MEKGLLTNYGKPLAYWIDLIHQEKLEKHKAMIDFLKTNHGFTYGYANFVAHKAKKSDAASQDDAQLIADQYKNKEALIPLYDKLIKHIQAFGTDITLTPKKAAVSLIRKRQFALIKPATKTRIDLGLKIKDQAVQGKLEASGPFGTMCTHRIQLSQLSDIDTEVLQWLKMAYEKSV